MSEDTQVNIEFEKTPEEGFVNNWRIALKKKERKKNAQSRQSKNSVCVK